MKKLLNTSLVLLAIMWSCVPAKEFQALQDKNLKCEEEREKFSTENEALTTRGSELDTKVKVLQSEVDKLIADSTNRAIEFNRLKDDNQKLNTRYVDLQQLQQTMMQGNQQETRKVLVQLQKSQEELQQKEDALKELERKLYQRRLSLDEAQLNVDKMNTELESRNTKLMELESKLSLQDSIMHALKKKVSDALFGFEGKGLTVRMQDGKVYVSLEEKLMFKSGSYNVDPRGATALKQLIPVLEQNTDINILVEGHTDDVPYKGSGDMLDNWDLSAKRSTTIVRILISGTKIDPVRITAAGRSEYLPLDKAKTPEARQKNRRTEIILTPKLDELMRMLESN